MSPSESVAAAPRVGYVLKMYPRFSETFVVNELIAVEHAGVQVDVFSLRPPVDARFHASLSRVRAGVTWVPRPTKPLEVWQVLRDAAGRLPGLAACLDDLLAEDASDAVQAVSIADAVVQRGLTHLHAHFGTVAATVARLAARLAGVTYSFTAHAKDIYVAGDKPDALRRNAFDAAHVVTVSDYNVAHLLRELGPLPRVVRVHNGIDLREFPFHDTRRERGVVAVGRLVEKKGFADLLDALALLRDGGDPVHLDLVGTGPLEADLRRQVLRLRLDDLVSFHGALTQDEVRQTVCAAAVLAAPCVIGADGNRDGLPTVVLEAMALGTAVVSTPVTGIPEAVRPDDTGLLVPEGDPVALADALRRLLDDEVLRTRLTRRARALVERDFDVERQARDLRRVFVESAESARVPGRPVLAGAVAS